MDKSYYFYLISDGKSSPFSVEPNKDISAKSATVGKQTESSINVRSVISAGMFAGAVKNVVTSTIHRVGDLTGDYNLQNKINNTQTLALYAGAMITNPIAGGIMIGTTLAQKGIEETIGRSKANAQANYLKNITNTSISKRSRENGNV
jgi:hypothetical protein